MVPFSGTFNQQQLINLIWLNFWLTWKEKFCLFNKKKRCFHMNATKSDSYGQFGCCCLFAKSNVGFKIVHWVLLHSWPELDNLVIQLWSIQLTNSDRNRCGSKFVFISEHSILLHVSNSIWNVNEYRQKCIFFVNLLECITKVTDFILIEAANSIDFFSFAKLNCVN